MVEEREKADMGSCLVRRTFGFLLLLLLLSCLSLSSSSSSDTGLGGAVSTRSLRSLHTA